MLLLLSPIAASAQIHEFEEHDQLVMSVGSLINPRNPLARHDSSFFTFCGYPREFQLRAEETLISKFFEEEKSDIGIHFRFLQFASDTKVCLRGLSASDFTVLREAISSGFWIQFILDDTSAYAPIGRIVEGEANYYSHWGFTVYHNGPYIIAVSVDPGDLRPLGPNTGSSFHYSLNWSATEAVSRGPPAGFGSFGIQFLSLLKITLVVMSLILGLTIALSRKVSRDMDRFENADEWDDFEFAGADRSWKSLHGDVFRAPQHCRLFAAVNGTAVHITVTILGFIFVNFAFRLYRTIGLAPVLILIFLACSVVSGYCARSIAFEFGDPGAGWAFLPSIVGITLPISVLLFATAFFDRSDLSVRFGGILILLNLAVVFPASYLGSLIAKQAPLFAENPCDVAVLPKRLPARKLSSHPVIICFVVGLCSAVMFIQETEVILIAIKRSMVSWLFLFLFVTLICAILVAAALAISAVYLLLAQEIHRWQWLSFLAPFSSAAFVFAYEVFYVVKRTHLRGWNDQGVYFIYSFVVALIYGMVCGSAGFFAANAFVRTIFSNLKFE
jgi:hypothetical protein